MERNLSMSDIANLIPQSLEMVLIDELVEVSEQTICTKSYIKPDNAFLQQGKFPSYNVLEIFAQSLALWRTKQEKSKKDSSTAQNHNKLGFLLGARGFEIFTPYVAVGEAVQAHLQVSMQDENGLGVYEGEAFVGGKLIAKTSLTALNPNDEFLAQILQGEKL